MFEVSGLEFEENPFRELSTLSTFEDIRKGRKCAVLVRTQDDRVPIVRTTTAYQQPVQAFLDIHHQIVENIKESFKEASRVDFNNAMIEIYDANYRTMRYHTDQALDLDPESYICLFSCYENEQCHRSDVRKLRVKHKMTNKSSEIALEHNSAILFSVSANDEHLHKIFLSSPKSKNRWLGVTLRLSKTWIQFVDQAPYVYPSDVILRIANKDERSAFLRYKGQENKSVGFQYPKLDHTISMSDTMPMQSASVTI